MSQTILFCRDIDKVDELMQDIAEQQELADEISTAISKPVGIGEDFDEVRTQNLTWIARASPVLSDLRS